MTELEQLTELCAKLGAENRVAKTMAAQLQKRATQFSVERGVTREEAMRYLLEVLVKGRQGESPENLTAPRPEPSMREKLITRCNAIFGCSTTVIARAPGRIEFIGNHTDYNGGTVLGAAIDRGVWVGLAPNETGVRRFCSEQHADIVELASDQIEQQTGASAWVNYPLGVLNALPEFELRAPSGFDFVVVSDLPTGAGLSSSAAIELASTLAFLEFTHQQVEREVVIKIGLHAENNFVGLPCGILDQAVSGFGQKNHLVYIECVGPKFTTVPIPNEAQFWIFNTPTKHALVDGLYAARHRECMEAARLLEVNKLVEVSPEQLDAKSANLPPTERRRARHIVEEIARVETTVEALRKSDLTTVGELLTASHRSSQHLFENSTAELDFLVDLLITIPGVYGARLTGGGFGGAVMALTDANFGETEAATVAKSYREKFSAKLDVLHTQTGDGAGLIDHL